MKRLVAFTQLDGKKTALVANRIIRVVDDDISGSTKIVFRKGADHLDAIFVQETFSEVVKMINDSYKK